MKQHLKSFFKRNFIFKNVFLWLSGISGYTLFSWLYDYAVIPFIVYKLGMIDGGIVVVLLSFFIDLGCLRFYDWIKKDILTIETIKNLQERKGITGKILIVVHDKTVILTIIVLSMAFNPFIATVYMRKGAFLFNGMKLRDWVIFIFSTLVSNIFWVALAAGGIEFIKYLIHVLQV